MDTEILTDLGLTNAEIKIYLALLELGKSTAGPIIKKTGLQNSVVHSTLPKLHERGFVSFIKKGGVKEYSASNPSNILKFIDEKKKRFELLLPELISKQKEITNQEAEIYHGINGLKAMLYKLIEDSKKGDDFLFFAFDTENPGDYESVYLFYRDEYHKERKNKGLNIKGLAPTRLKQMILKANWSKQSVKFVDFPIPTNISVCRDKIAFTPWEDEKVSFLIHSKQLADSFRNYFNSIWKEK